MALNMCERRLHIGLIDHVFVVVHKGVKKLHLGPCNPLQTLAHDYSEQRFFLFSYFVIINYYLRVMITSSGRFCTLGNH